MFHDFHSGFNKQIRLHSTTTSVSSPFRNQNGINVPLNQKYNSTQQRQQKISKRYDDHQHLQPNYGFSQNLPNKQIPKNNLNLPNQPKRNTTVHQQIYRNMNVQKQNRTNTYPQTLQQNYNQLSQQNTFQLNQAQEIFHPFSDKTKKNSNSQYSRSKKNVKNFQNYHQFQEKQQQHQSQEKQHDHQEQQQRTIPTYHNFHSNNQRQNQSFNQNMSQTLNYNQSQNQYPFTSDQNFFQKKMEKEKQKQNQRGNQRQIQNPNQRHSHYQNQSKKTPFDKQNFYSRNSTSSSSFNKKENEKEKEKEKHLPKLSYSKGVFSTIFDPNSNQNNVQREHEERSLKQIQKEVLFPMQESHYDESQFPKFDHDFGKTWVYPTNYPVRDYQLNISHASLYSNTLVVLPTGLGKTLIAAVVLINYYRWYPEGKIIFMAPTKPLVTQQIEAIFKTVGIASEYTCEITGQIVAKRRSVLWQNKRVFYGTPQTVYNDLRNGICPAEKIVCLIFDEAHKATGNYAYCNTIKEVLKKNNRFRVLALSATPGTTFDQIQNVIGNLLIAKLEARFDDKKTNCLDISGYQQKKKIQVITVSNEHSEELKLVQNIFSPFLKQILEILCDYKVFMISNPDHTSKGRIFEDYKKFKNSKANMQGQMFSQTDYSKIINTFILAISLFHGYKLLLEYGMNPFYQFLLDKYENIDNCSTASKRSFKKSSVYKDLMSMLPQLLEKSAQGHPKLKAIKKVVSKHFQEHKNTETKVMIFSAFRSSVIDITKSISELPLVKVMPFIGQGSTTNQRGYTQNEQKLIIEKFKQGGYNTLVATSIGEEGLDIGEIDLIICYDMQSNPKRTVQRFGRTGRKRKGEIVVLLTKGREEQIYKRNQRQKIYIQRQLSNPNKFIFYDKNPRMVPKTLKPKLEKKKFDINSCNIFSPSFDFELQLNKDGVFFLKQKKNNNNNNNIFNSKKNNKGIFLSRTEQQYFNNTYSLSSYEFVPKLSLSKSFKNQKFISPIFNFGHSKKTFLLMEKLKLIDEINYKQNFSDLEDSENKVRSEVSINKNNYNDGGGGDDSDQEDESDEDFYDIKEEQEEEEDDDDDDDDYDGGGGYIGDNGVNVDFGGGDDRIKELVDKRVYEIGCENETESRELGRLNKEKNQQGNRLKLEMEIGNREKNDRIINENNKNNYQFFQSENGQEYSEIYNFQNNKNNHSKAINQQQLYLKKIEKNSKGILTNFDHIIISSESNSENEFVDKGTGKRVSRKIPKKKPDAFDSSERLDNRENDKERKLKDVMNRKKNGGVELKKKIKKKRKKKRKQKKKRKRKKKKKKERKKKVNVTWKGTKKENVKENVKGGSKKKKKRGGGGEEHRMEVNKTVKARVNEKNENDLGNRNKKIKNKNDYNKISNLKKTQNIEEIIAFNNRDTERKRKSSEIISDNKKKKSNNNTYKSSRSNNEPPRKRHTIEVNLLSTSNELSGDFTDITETEEDFDWSEMIAPNNKEDDDETYYSYDDDDDDYNNGDDDNDDDDDENHSNKATNYFSNDDSMEGEDIYSTDSEEEEDTELLKQMLGRFIVSSSEDD
ncbi:fanconi anemia group m protein [Anaeramoeba flamelloides]|uniref:Fanconi anemia group m protein n=1 Tax=Anaeramoeba flamelloides TaxID=1746091 RepID=A0ABQ8Y094_9EUKA|nr:fanconi anemia group m protein [Anaeramoeba flamelloides]